MEQKQIYFITPKDLQNKEILYNFIYPNKDVSYYVSDDFSPNFYVELAHAGFISVSLNDNGQDLLLPEIQFEYAVLDFKNLHISKKIKKLLNQDKKFELRINQNFDAVIDSIINYHKDAWLDGKYKKLLNKLKSFQHPTIDFKLLSIELIDTTTNKLIAGEIGYKIKNTYTSLSGFRDMHKDYNNCGKLQMTLLAKYLERDNYHFWNMGHPYMQYKLDMGAKILTREDFLKRWLVSRI